MTALRICRDLFLLKNRLVRYWGMVMESPAAMENRRSRGAMTIQLTA